jgi:hypothetical protein
MLNYEAAAMGGHEIARHELGGIEKELGNMDPAVKHWKIAASAGYYRAMHALITCYEKGDISRESINSTLEAYNNSCAEMKSEAIDACIRFQTDNMDTLSSTSSSSPLWYIGLT